MTLFKTLAFVSLVLTASVSASFAAFGQGQAALGAWIGALWMFANLSFMMRLVEIGMGGGAKKHILPLSIVKFPVLYAAGFFILQSRSFPVSGILAGLTAVVAAFTFAWFRTAPAAGKTA